MPLGVGSKLGILYPPQDPAILFRDTFDGGMVDPARWNKIDNTYNPTELITNGTFGSDITGWTDASDVGSSIDWLGGLLRLNSNGSSTARARQSITTVAGNYYTLTVDAILGSPPYSIGTSAGGSQIASGTLSIGANSISFTAIGTTTWLEFSRSTNGNSRIDNVSIAPNAGLITASGGLIRFSGGYATPGWGGPAMVSIPNWARRAGLCCEWQVTPGAVDKYLEMGFTDGSLDADGIELHSIQTAPNNLLIIFANASSILIPLRFTAASLWCRIVLATTGAYYYVSSDNKVTWTLIWIDVTVTTATLYAFIESYNAALTASEVNVSMGSVIPALLSASPGAPTLTLGDELATGTLTVGTWYQITATEVDHFFTGSAIGNIFRATATTGLDANNKVKPLPFDTTGVLTYIRDSGRKLGIARALITVGAGYHAGFVICADSATAPTNCLYCYYDRTAGKAYLMKVTAGSPAELIASTVAYGAASEARIVITGPVTAARVGLYYGTVGVPPIQSTIQGPYDLSGYGSHCFRFSTDAASLVNSFEFHGGVGTL